MFQILKKGFTLIELLVVISIIALLTAVVVGQLNGARAKARDRALFSSVQEIQKALELYRSKYGEYPDSTPSVVGDSSRYYWGVNNMGGCTGGGNNASYNPCDSGKRLTDKLSDFLPTINPPKIGQLLYYNIKANSYSCDGSTANIPPYIIVFVPETTILDFLGRFYSGNKPPAGIWTSYRCVSIK